jgi:hypothetical protein
VNEETLEERVIQSVGKWLTTVVGPTKEEILDVCAIVGELVGKATGGQIALAVDPDPRLTPGYWISMVCGPKSMVLCTIRVVDEGVFLHAGDGVTQEVKVTNRAELMEAFADRLDDEHVAQAAARLIRGAM